MTGKRRFAEEQSSNIPLPEHGKVNDQKPYWCAFMRFFKAEFCGKKWPSVIDGLKYRVLRYQFGKNTVI